MNAPLIKIGDRVKHVDSGWTGIVSRSRDDDTGMRGTQGPLVTVDPVCAGGKTWKPITVTQDELGAIGG